MAELKIPISLVAHSDIAHLKRELDELEGKDMASRAGKKEADKADLSAMLTQLVELNKVDLGTKKGRDELSEGLSQLQAKAPQIHITFASEASAKATEQILTWLRRNIHPQVLLQIGLQPAIAAGCVLRTPNKLFDFSLRSHLDKQKQYLVQLISQAVNAGAAAAAPQKGPTQ